MTHALKDMPLTFRQLPAVWEELTAMRPLRPIHDEADQEQATAIIDLMAGHELTADQDDYLDALSTLVAAYEAEHDPLPFRGRTGLEVLRSLLEDHGMNASDLARLLGVHRSHGAKILRGERALTTRHMKLLGERFKVRADLFLE